MSIIIEKQFKDSSHKNNTGADPLRLNPILELFLIVSRCRSLALHKVVCINVQKYEKSFVLVGLIIGCWWAAPGCGIAGFTSARISGSSSPSSASPPICNTKNQDKTRTRDRPRCGRAGAGRRDTDRATRTKPTNAPQTRTGNKPGAAYTGGYEPRRLFPPARQRCKRHPCTKRMGAGSRGECPARRGVPLSAAIKWRARPAPGISGNGAAKPSGPHSRTKDPHKRAREGARPKGATPDSRDAASGQKTLGRQRSASPGRQLPRRATKNERAQRAEARPRCGRDRRPPARDQTNGRPLCRHKPASQETRRTTCTDTPLLYKVARVARHERLGSLFK